MWHLYAGALETLKEALRYGSRDPAILRLNRFVRARVYDEMGQRAKARNGLGQILRPDV